ncbi:MAG: hypothetical protein HFH41_07435 [Lachnospiraceae bacterium]|nr:hypothetical protein [Lachnospiraceae bacterium]
MKKISIAICDAEQAYGEKLGEWISLEKQEEMKSYYFSSLSVFLEFQRIQELDVILLGKGFWGNIQIIEQMKEQKSLWICLYDPAEENFSEEEQGFPRTEQEVLAVRKYQPASEIIREIFFYYQKYGKQNRDMALPEGEVLGIYSPDHSIWRTPFALTFAQTLGKEERVLYVNLNECAGFERWFQKKYHRDLLDVIYLCLVEGGNISDCIGSAVYRTEGFDYIPPAADGACLGEISKEDYLRFVRLLAEKSSYDVVILDFGIMIPGFFELLEECSSIYIAAEGGELREGPLQHFRQMTARQNRQGLEKKISYLNLPRISENLYQGEEKMQHWIWGELGDYTRRLMGVQSGTD